MKRWQGAAWTLFFLGFIFSIAEAEEIRYDNAGRRDPFLPVAGPDAGTATSSGFTIEGIVYDPGGGSYALINGQIYREGENFEGAKLVRILADRVILMQSSEEVVIWLKQEVLDESTNKNKGRA